tara:strand:- start:17731 stop:18990 length:1260 start_codon:yes stop_codon:yes gene_type:complete
MKKLFSIKILLSPWVILGSLVSSFFIGHYAPIFSLQLQPFGELFLDLLKMCVIPIVITAIPSGFAHMLMKKFDARILRRMALMFVMVALLLSFVGIVVAEVFHFGNLTADAKQRLGQLLLQDHTASAAASHGGSGSALTRFMSNFVSGNIFIAFVNNNMLAILTFAIMFGLALGLICTQAGEQVVLTLQGLFAAFLKLINGLIYFLPFGIICLISAQVASTGFEVFKVASQLIIGTYAIGTVAIVIAIFTLSRLLKSPWYRVIYHFREMLIIAFVSQSSYASFPLGLKAFEQKYRLNQDKVNLFFPLTVVLSPVGMAVLASMTTVFAANLYSIHLNLSDLVVVWLAAVFISIAIGGVPAVIGMTMMSIAFHPLGIPLGPMVILLIAISNIVDPIITVMNASINAAEVAYLTKVSEKHSS